ncbi:MAG: hypothetical protein AB1571_00695 [Nanoarchaeota archaeon]
MNKGIIILVILGVIVAGAILATVFMNTGTPTAYVVKNVSNVAEDKSAEQQKVVEGPKITGPVKLSLGKGSDINLGYMPKELIVNDLKSGVTIKLGTIELTIGPASDTALYVALRTDKLSNIRLSDGVVGNYITTDGELEFLYKNYALYVKRLTNPNNYPDAK